MCMLEKFKESRDRGEKFGALFTDLSKAFDCIDQNVPASRLSGYRVNTTKSFNLIFSYLRNRTQSVRINNYSNKYEIMYGVPQGSVLRHLLFSIDLIDLFLERENDKEPSIK